MLPWFFPKKHIFPKRHIFSDAQEAFASAPQVKASFIDMG